MTAAMACRSCGAEPRAGVRFCDACGTAVTQSIASAALSGEMMWRGVTTSASVEALLSRGAESDLAEADAAVDRLMAIPVDPGFVLDELPSLRLRALLARARGNDSRYRDFRDRYRKMAADIGFEGHTPQAEAMT